MQAKIDERLLRPYLLRRADYAKVSRACLAATQHTLTSPIALQDIRDLDSSTPSMADMAPPTSAFGLGGEVVKARQLEQTMKELESRVTAMSPSSSVRSLA